MTLSLTLTLPPTLSPTLTLTLTPGDISLTRASGESSWKSGDTPFPIYNYDTEEDDTDTYFIQDFQWVLTVDGIASWTNVSHGVFMVGN